MANNNLVNMCERFFGVRNFYEVLEIPKYASKVQIKKAYYRLSLIVHPDRVEHTAKEVATEKFKVLGMVHSILSDDDKRKIYDETGQYAVETEEVIMKNWSDYWRMLFKKITMEDLVTYENSYKGSESELDDIRNAYLKSKGDMDFIFETVPFTSYSDEPRLRSLIENLIQKGEVPKYKKFAQDDVKKKLQRKRKWQKETKEADEMRMKEESHKARHSSQELNLAIHAKTISRLSQNNDFFDSLIQKYVQSPKKSKKKMKK